jgi:tetratricopeptide (TPR) repeat protein
MLQLLRARVVPFRSVRTIPAKTGWLVLSISFIVLGCPSASAQAPSKELDRVKVDARYSIWLGDFDKAIADYKEWLQLEPNSLPAEIGLAQSYRGVHNYDEARGTLELAVRDHPRNAETFTSLGDLDIEMQSYDDAIHHLTAALALAPTDVEALDRLAVAYKAKGDIPNALAQIAKVLARDPKNALAYYTRARIESDENRDALALPDVQKAVLLQPNNHRGRVLLGEILLRAPQGATPASIEKRCARAVVILEPLFPKPEKVQTTYVGPTAADHSEDLYALSGQPRNAEELYLLSRAYECAGQADRARETLAAFEAASQEERAAKENATQAKHLVEQANAAAQKNDLSGALDLLQQALAKDSTYGPAYSQLAKIEYSEGDLEKASDTITHALESDPYQPDFLYVQGKILEKEGKLDQALAVFEKTTLVNPKEADAFFEMGVIYQQRNDHAHALAAYKKAVELSPDDPDYRRALAGLQ